MHAENMLITDAHAEHSCSRLKKVGILGPRWMQGPKWSHASNLLLNHGWAACTGSMGATFSSLPLEVFFARPYSASTASSPMQPPMAMATRPLLPSSLFTDSLDMRRRLAGIH